MSSDTIERTLPAPRVTDGSGSILAMASLIASGEHKGATFEIDGVAFTFAAHIEMPDGTVKREVLNIRPIINEWVTQMIEEGATA